MKPGQRGDLRRDNARSYPEADFVPAKLPRRPGSILIDIRFSNEIDLNQSGSSNHGRWNGIDKLHYRSDQREKDLLEASALNLSTSL